jgi:hypothetical protein
MDLISLMYTSVAGPDFQVSDLQAIQCSAKKLNKAAGITGLLVFNGIHFLQILEGKHCATEELLKRLRADPRHSGLEVRDERRISERSFPSWPMEVVQVNGNYFEARDAIGDQLPETVPEIIKLRLLRMTELISTMGFN